MRNVRFVNLTPEDVVLTSGEKFVTEGNARVDASFGTFDENDISSLIFGDVTGLLPRQPGVVYIVSPRVRQAIGNGRADLVSPAANHPSAVRGDDGHLVSVPGFVK